MEFYIEQVNTFSEELIDSLNSLLKQLNDKVDPLVKEDIEEIISSSKNHLFVGRKSDTKEIVGMLTLATYKIPVGKKAWIEDLVVDSKYRNNGIATSLIKKAIEIAKDENIKYINFTSRPQRESANKLYDQLGFKKRDTNVYQVEL